MRLSLTVCGHHLITLHTGQPEPVELDPDCYWVIRGSALLNALHQAHHGEMPGTVYAELYANSSHEQD